MRVRCIFPGPWEGPEGWVPQNGDPIEGHIYTVSEEFEDFQGAWLVLVEYDKDDLFARQHFRPLDEVDEMVERAKGCRTPEKVKELVP